MSMPGVRGDGYAKQTRISVDATERGKGKGEQQKNQYQIIRAHRPCLAGPRFTRNIGTMPSYGAAISNRSVLISIDSKFAGKRVLEKLG
jgi:hypothetical protein